MKKLLPFLSLLLFQSSFLFSQNGIITTVAGNYLYGPGYSGDGGVATSAELHTPTGVAVDRLGNVYIADFNNNVIRELNVSSGKISTVAGKYPGGGYLGDGGAATSAMLWNPTGVAVDTSGNIYIADNANNVIRKVTFSTGIITTVAGNNSLPNGFSGDGGAATDAELNYPWGISVDNSGNIYIGDPNNNVIREVYSSSGKINTVAGNFSLGLGYSGDGGAATSAELHWPAMAIVGDSGNIYISDEYNFVVRKVTVRTGIISTIAGNHYYGAGYSGDGGAATSAELNYAQGISFDGLGNLFIADYDNNVIRKVNASTDIISTVAGNNTLGGGYSGDNGPATSAQIYDPTDIVIDASENLFIADWKNNLIRKVTGLATSISQLPTSNSQLSLYPNPARDEIYVQMQGNEKAEEMEIYNITGGKVLEQKQSFSQYSILNTQYLPAGLYFLKVTLEDGSTEVRKVEVMR